MFHNKEKTESQNETWAHFFHGPPGKGYFSSVSVHPETGLIFSTFKERINDNKDATHRRMRRR